jgi:hypothetical protein
MSDVLIVGLPQPDFIATLARNQRRCTRASLLSQRHEAANWKGKPIETLGNLWLPFQSLLFHSFTSTS